MLRHSSNNSLFHIIAGRVALASSLVAESGSERRRRKRGSRGGKCGMWRTMDHSPRSSSHHHHQLSIKASSLPHVYRLCSSLPHVYRLCLSQVWPEVYLIFALDTAYGDTMAAAIDTVFLSYATGADNVHPLPQSIGDAYSWIKPSDAVLKSLALQQQQQQSTF